MKSAPFSRSRNLMSLIASAMMGGLSRILAADAVTAKHGAYVSRGKGRGGRSGKSMGNVPSGKYARTFNGEREVNRRLRQIANGQLQVAV